MPQQWYVQTSKGTAGPFTPMAIRRLARTGKISPKSRVSLDGHNWMAASRIKGLEFLEEKSAQRPAARPSTSPITDYDCQLLLQEHADSTADRPHRGPSTGDPASDLAELHLSAINDEKSPDLSSAEGLSLRVGLSFSLGAVGAASMAGLVKTARFVGLVELNTTATSLAARVGLPAIAFVVVFAFIYWSSGREVDQPRISADMSDDEIGEALRHY
jgi:uncharacterized protein DUF4339